jgi:uncharacterized protein YndB with AHSA1/START domain
MQPLGCESGYDGLGDFATVELRVGWGTWRRDMGERDRVVREVVLPAGRNEVWDAITQPERLADWFGGEVEIDPAPRGRVAHRAPDGSVRTGFVLSADRPFRLSFWWVADGDDGDPDDGTQVEFVLLEHAEGTALTVTEFPAANPAIRGTGPSPAMAL